MKRKGLSRLTVGIITVVVVAVGSYLGFTKDIPFTKPFEIKAVFENGDIRPGSPVRIAGVQVGKVQGVAPQPGTDTSVVTMAINKNGRPLHSDATAKIRPRIFLEGNFFVDLTTGTPTAPKLGSGDTLKVTQTSSPVQLDEVLTALQGDTRKSLQSTLSSISTALSDKPTAAQDAANDASVRGQTGAQALNDALDDLAPAQRDVAILNEALLGTQPDRDLRRLLNGLARTTGGLSANEPALRDLVTNLATAMRAFASEQDNLRVSIRELGPTLTTANRTFDSLNASFPSIRGFSRDAIPAMRVLPGVIDAGLPWIVQARRLVSQRELRGLARDLAPATRDVARFVDSATELLPEVDLASRCVADVVLPTGDVVIEDQFANGQPNYREFAYVLAALAGEGSNFDGNGQAIRLQAGGGPNAVSIGGRSPGEGGDVGSGFPGLGTQPAKPARKPPIESGTPCKDSALPDLNGPAAARGTFGTPLPGPGTRELTSSRERSSELQALRSRLRPFGTKRTLGEDEKTDRKQRGE